MSTDHDEMERRSTDRGAMASMMKEMNQKLNTALTQLGKVSAQVDSLSSGFPDGDPTGHRRLHEIVAAREKKREEFWEKLRYELAKWGLIGFAGWALYALWAAGVKGPK
jgi:hypothetical protein